MFGRRGRQREEESLAANSQATTTTTSTTSSWCATGAAKENEVGKKEEDENLRCHITGEKTYYDYLYKQEETEFDCVAMPVSSHHDDNTFLQILCSDAIIWDMDQTPLLLPTQIGDLFSTFSNTEPTTLDASTTCQLWDLDVISSTTHHGVSPL